jgi:lipopolysaccharide transport system ATP-binding protein
MSETIIQVENIGKKYLIRHHTKERYVALRDVITRKAVSIGSRLFSPKTKEKADPTREEFWALKDVSFEVKRGDVIGIIGRNGAGKSTLLKILSRITEPTTGKIRIKGRVASLLEVGTGFHPELTGRENIYLNGAILGMSKSEIKGKFDEIVAFSEVEKFLDTPVKRYSSGMYVRLAFAVAAHLECEILLIDEILSVGDLAFQKRCLQKMDDVRNLGRTVIFVSHNMGTVRTLCTSVIFLRKGEIQAIGDTSSIVQFYTKSTAEECSSSGEIAWRNRETAPGDNQMRLLSIRLSDANDEVQNIFDPEKPIRVEIIYEIFERIRGMRLVLQILNSEGIVAFTSTDQKDRNEEYTPGIYRTVAIIPSFLLNYGFYNVKIHAGCPGIKVLVKGQEFLRLFVEKTVHHGSTFPENWPGVIAPRLKWTTEACKKN